MNEKGKVPEPEDRFAGDLKFISEHGILNCLLKDRTTGRNIIWANGGADEREVIRKGDVKRIRPRWLKDEEARKQRTRANAEVFTPSGICKEMVEALGEAGFDSEKECSLTSTCLEITCGEAPFIASRYDMETGETIDIDDRFGLLDRKLECAKREARTLEGYRGLALEALKSVYGYEFQGDSLFMARVNVLMDFTEHWRGKWKAGPDSRILQAAAEAISWNFWQMDGLSNDCLPPLKKLKEKKPVARSMFAEAEEQGGKPEDLSSPCVIKLWNEGSKGRKVEFRELFIKEDPLKQATLEKNRPISPSGAVSGMISLF